MRYPCDLLAEIVDIRCQLLVVIQSVLFDDFRIVLAPHLDLFGFAYHHEFGSAGDIALRACGQEIDREQGYCESEQGRRGTFDRSQ